MFRLSIYTTLIAFGLLIPPVAAEDVVNIYSSRHYDTDIALYENFTKETGITVNLIEGKSDALIERILTEGKYSPADILVTVDAGRLWRAEKKGIFQSISSSKLSDKIPAYLRHPDGLWYGLSKRARVIIYTATSGKPEGLDRYEDLADPKFKGKICIRSSSNIYNISLLASMIERNGEDAAEKWAKAVVANFARPPQGNDTAQIRAVASGECAVALVNTYYIARQRSSDKPANQKVGNGVGIIFPNQDDVGTHVNISGAGVVKTSPNKENAVRFLEYLTEEPAQRLLAEGNNEYPIVAGISLSAAVNALGTFKDDKLNASILGKNQAKAVRIFDRAKWY